eukprot:scaffold40081_cov32-Tisochrysis_lutea.AAC.5
MRVGTVTWEGVPCVREGASILDSNAESHIPNINKGHAGTRLFVVEAASPAHVHKLADVIGFLATYGS